MAVTTRWPHAEPAAAAGQARTACEGKKNAAALGGPPATRRCNWSLVQTAETTLVLDMGATRSISAVNIVQGTPATCDGVAFAGTAAACAATVGTCAVLPAGTNFGCDANAKVSAAACAAFGGAGTFTSTAVYVAASSAGGVDSFTVGWADATFGAAYSHLFM